MKFVVDSFGRLLPDWPEPTDVFPVGLHSLQVVFRRKPTEQEAAAFLAFIKGADRVEDGQPAKG